VESEEKARLRARRKRADFRMPTNTLPASAASVRGRRLSHLSMPQWLAAALTAPPAAVVTHARRAPRRSAAGRDCAALFGASRAHPAQPPLPAGVHAAAAAALERAAARAGASASAASPVYNLYAHVLCVAFSFASLRDLSALMRVCRAWQAAVLAMPPLQLGVDPRLSSGLFAGRCASRLRRHVSEMYRTNHIKWNKTIIWAPKFSYVLIIFAVNDWRFQ
jgi:hypothetical protein